MKIKEKYNDSDLNAFKLWNFELSDFQKWAIRGLSQDKNIIITAHTGSGKTLPAEYAIHLFCKEKRKKVIYCAPIKALSNEKFKDFNTKFGDDISVGILTGDIKFNPEGDLLIMTTEILRNNLFQKKIISDGDDSTKEKISKCLDFDIDLDNELACVIFDEIHYINDKDRGKVWEETIMMLNPNCQILGLSATINKPENFCEWIEKTKEKEVWLCPNEKRVVPLIHYAWLSYPKSIINRLPNKEKNDVIEFTDKAIEIKKPGEKFNDRNFYCIEKIINYFNKNDIRINKYFVLNKLINHLYYDQKLPAICFCFSRQQTLELAQKIELNLFEKDEKYSSTVKAECIKILKKIPNYKEYIELEEFHILVSLLEKGIAIHHSGINAVFREMIELLFAKKYIRLLIATETFAVGINMPTRSVIFTSLQKFDGRGFRFIHPHEYTQMAGRAGRRNIDIKGYVFHLHNFYAKNHPNIETLKNVITGNAQTIQSKFYIHYNLLLRLIGSGQNDFSSFVENSMINQAIKADLNRANREKAALLKRYQDYSELIPKLRTDISILEKYNSIMIGMSRLSQKKRKRAMNEIAQIKMSNPSFDKDYNFYKETYNLENDINKITKDIDNINSYISDNIATHLAALKSNKFIDENEEGDNILTVKGEVASNIQEIHCMAFAEAFIEGRFNQLTVPELISALSIFTPIRLKDDYKFHTLINVNISANTKNCIDHIEVALKKYHSIETYLKTHFIESYETHYDMCEFMYNWAIAENEEKCKTIIKEAKSYDIFLGEFVKSILKINNIAKEMERLCEISENIKLLEKVIQIPKMTLKFVATNESLYV